MKCEGALINGESKKKLSASVSSIKPTHSSNAYNYFIVYFNIFYFSGISPFRFKYNHSLNYYQMQVPSTSRKIFCVFMQTISLLASISYARSAMPIAKFKESPNELFKIFNSLSFVIFYIPGLIFIIWKKTKYFQAFLHIYQQAMIKDKKRIQAFSKETYTASIAATLAILMCFSITITMGYDSAPVLEQTILGKLKSRIGLLQYNLHLRENRTSLGPDEDVEVGWAVGSIGYNISSYYYACLSSVFAGFPVFAAITLYSISKNFSKMLRKDSGILHEQILEKYFVFKEMIRNLNAVASTAVIINLLTSLPYYPIQIIELLDGENLYTLAYMMESVTCIIFAAEANRKFNEIKNWTLSVDPSVADKLGNRLMMVYVDSSMTPLGLQGGDLFTITYKLIGTGLSVLTTYIFISLQFSPPSPITPPK